MEWYVTEITPIVSSSDKRGHMTYPDFVKIHSSAVLLILTLVSMLLIVGCQTHKYESRLLKHVKTKDDKLTMSATELRLELNEVAGVFKGTIEKAADEVIAKSKNSDIMRHALLWKINGIPLAYKAIFRPDPAVAFVDSLAFSMQMVEYFNIGFGKEDFGEWHHIALRASQEINKYIKELGQKGRTDGNIKPLEGKIQLWVNENPIERDFNYRDTTIPDLNSMLGEVELSTMQSLGSIGLTVEEVSYRLSVYMDLLTKQASWQAELVMIGNENQPSIQDGLNALNELGAFVKRVGPLGEEIPDWLTQERENIKAAIRQERIEILTNIDQQRLDTLKYLTAFRIKVTEDLTAELLIIMDTLLSEREAVLQSIDEQRIATLKDIESAGNRIVSKMMKQGEPLVDYIFIRVLQLLAVVFVCGIVGTAIFFRLKGKKNTDVNEP